MNEEKEWLCSMSLFSNLTEPMRSLAGFGVDIRFISLISVRTDNKVTTKRKKNGLALWLGYWLDVIWKKNTRMLFLFLNSFLIFDWQPIEFFHIKHSPR